jgi:DNA-binding transcriptional regulator YiaG
VNHKCRNQATNFSSLLDHLHSPWGYGEPEILRYSNRQFGPIGADDGQHDVDALCLTPVEPFSAEEIRALRLRENASQAVFALHLNVTTGPVRQWERGEKQPSGASLKMQTLVARKGLQAVA